VDHLSGLRNRRDRGRVSWSCVVIVVVCRGRGRMTTTTTTRSRLTWRSMTGLESRAEMLSNAAMASVPMRVVATPPPYRGRRLGRQVRVLVSLRARARLRG
jgi:hypothetical protein